MVEAIYSVWVVYGIVVKADESRQARNPGITPSKGSAVSIPPLFTHSPSPSDSLPPLLAEATPYLSFAKPAVMTAYTFIESSRSSISSSSVHLATFTPSAPTVKQTKGLSNEAKVGVGVSVGVLGFVVVFVGVIDACCLRGKRRERGVEYARGEVERGTSKETEEHIVLESRVEVVFADEDEGGRNGISLARRD
ncbi:uncharacterized protein BDR25DRAFT_345886 [Lindgomyces ingoldianus]|uniref:Uncharacterized protein n=1 Tax=Lindgomyces ingoldianus TaxID=673940 RepID=A0ACB6QG63_9PLEO|nr:uncharacterized protein BDR25DRAFT_345886 [Lindgomyces ingoldianus]KAF2466019.1 hypothetical protein BDR25DRAFT_345886 [Lindgomyces ingoldianus]